MAWQLYLEDSNQKFPPYSSRMEWFYGGKEPSLYGQTPFTSMGAC